MLHIDDVAQKVVGFCGLFFCGINKTQNLHELQKVYSECFVFCGVFCENICEITAKLRMGKNQFFIDKAGFIDYR